MAQTPKLPLELLANSAGNQVNANTSFQILAQLVQAAVLDKDLATPPGSPADGAMYIVASSPTGAWSGKATQLAYWLSSAGVWQFIVPREGWEVHVDDENEYYKFDGTSWAIKASGGGANIGQNAQSGAYTLVISDAGKHIFHPAADTTARIWTIPANASVPFAIGDTVTFVVESGSGDITIAITSDTLQLAGSGATGSRTLASGGIATALKITATKWLISGVGLS